MLLNGPAFIFNANAISALAGRLEGRKELDRAELARIAAKLQFNRGEESLKRMASIQDVLTDLDDTSRNIDRALAQSPNPDVHLISYNTQPRVFRAALATASQRGLSGEQILQVIGGAKFIEDNLTTPSKIIKRMARSAR